MSYQYIKPTGGQLETMEEFRGRFERLHEKIKKEVSHSRGRSACLTKLEEASFWLNKAITLND